MECLSNYDKLEVAKYCLDYINRLHSTHKSTLTWKVDQSYNICGIYKWNQGHRVKSAW